MIARSSSAIRRVLMTADAIGGVWTFALELCRGLARHDVEVVLATMGPRPRFDQRAAAAVPGNIVLCESSYDLEWMADPWDDVARAGDWLLGLARQYRPDVVHLNGYVHGALPWTAPVVAVGHSCVLSWWAAVCGAPVPEQWRQYARAVRAGLAGAQRVVAPTAWMAEALAFHYGPLPPQSVIPNGLDPPAGDPPRKQPVIAAAGRLWDEAKNLGVLAQIAAELPWPVQVAGERHAPDGSVRDWSGLELLGRLSPGEMAALYGRAALFAAPARYEPFGLAILEAAQAGCALVLGDIASLRENWTGAAEFVAVDDPAAWRDRLTALAADPDRVRRLGARARARAAHFSGARMADAYLELYRALRRGAPLAPAQVLAA